MKIRSGRIQAEIRRTKSTRWRVIVLLLACVLPSAATAVDDPSGRLGARLRAKLETLQGSEEIAVNVVLRAPSPAPARAATRASRRQAIRERQQRVLDALPRQGLRLGRRHQNVSGFSLWASPEVIDALARHPDTALVYLDGRVRGVLAQGTALVGADQAHAVGVTGAGVNIAVIDSGIDTDHPDLADDLVAERCWCRAGFGLTGCCPNGFDTQSGAGSAEDAGGHGTNVTGVLTSPSGVAPDAGIVALKVLDDDGTGSFSDIDAALDWLTDNHVSLGVRVVNLSLGDSTENSNPLLSPCSGSNTANLIDTLHDEGLAVFVASGNDGHDDGISFPACVPQAISVGGVYEASLGSVSWCGDTCATTLCMDSSITPDDFVCHTNSDEILDLLAPDWRTSTSEVGGGTASFGGTSMAAPYAAGMAALLIEQDPTRTPAQVLSLLSSNGPTVTNPDNGLSFSRADVGALFAECGDGIPQSGEDCDDGNLLNGDCCSSTCGFELAGADCDDADLCTTPDVCNGAGACVGAALDCDDGVFCNGGESCDPVGGCQAGVPPTLDDGVACTIDACDEGNDVVTHVADPGFCDDALWCNGGEVCDLLTGCGPGSPRLLEDGIGCTTGSCDEVNDVVVQTPDDAACNDGAWCNGEEHCDVQSDCQSGPSPPLGDGVACTVDACDEDADRAVHIPDEAACDDGDPCTAESCDPLLGCVTDPVPLCSAAVPTGGPLGLWITALAMALCGMAWLGASRRERAAVVPSRRE